MRHTTTTLLATIALLFSSLGVSATTYYVSPSGNDSNNGTSQGSAWRTVARAQQLQYVLQPGDRILFERGGTYSGQLDINSNGSASQPIVIGAYGTGALPVISGSIAATTWTQHQGNIWRASVAQPVKYVRVNGALQTLARYPNSGWLRVNTSSNTQLNSTSLTQANGYWNGARLVVRSTNWCYENAETSGFSNGTLSFPAITYNPGNYDWGFFVCNKLSELDSPGEWYHDANAGVLYLWAPGNADPNGLNVQASVFENGVNVGWQKSHVRIEDLLFRGQRYAGVNNGGASYVTITGCTFEWLNHAIRSYGNNDNYSGNIIRNTFASGMALIDNNTTVENNTITDIALIPGLGESFWGYYGMYALGDDNVIRNNRITNTGNSGMFLEGSPLVEKNVIIGPLATVNDGGGIYWDNSDGMIIQDNIIKDLDGNMESVAMDYHVNYKIGHGIYFGNAVINNTIVRRNTVSGCRGAGIHVDHTMVSNGIQVRDNVLYDNDIQLSLSDYSNYNGPGATPPYHVPSYNSVYSGNTLYCMSKEQLCVQQYHVYSNNLVDFGTFTNNRHFNPFNELTTFVIKLYSGNVKYYSLERWQAERGEEVGSTRSPHRQNSHEVTSTLSANLVANSTFDYNTNG
ncbi:MAG: right-handed parallel beta-helix repeat-containing protein [Flavobacteriales bacterium]